MHKRDSHPSAADELAGFEDLDHPSLVTKTARISRLLGTTFVSPSSTSARLGASSLVTHPVRSAGISVLSTVNSSARPVPSTSTSSSSVVRRDVRTMVGKTVGDSYFTYRIAHDTDGRVQAYECDICGFRSVHINDMFTHASTHSLADLTKSGAAAINNVVWECFYCSFSAPLQASVVSHVIASHPNQPIQLKRLPSTPAAVTGGKTSIESSTSFKSVSSSSSSTEVTPLSPEQSASDKTASAVVLSTKLADVRAERKRKSDASDEGCIWGCYYCSMQSASRNDIISHLKKQHSSEKLVITRRRITHVATGSSGGAGGKPSAAVASGDEDKPSTDTTANTLPTTEPEEGTRAEEDGRVVASSTSMKSQSLTSVDDSQQSAVLPADSGEPGDQSFIGMAASAKSRRKQMAPRRVADELAAAATAAAAASGDKSITNDIVALAVDEVMRDMAPTTCEALPAVLANPAVGTNSSRSLLTSSSVPRKHSRSSTSKYDNLIKKLKMADSAENGMDLASLLDKPRLDEPFKTSSPTTRSSQGKALSLLTGQLVSGYVQPPNSVPTLSSPNHNSALNCRGNSAVNSRQSSGLKVSVIQYVEKKLVDRSQYYVYDATRLTARCSVCGTTARGSDVLKQIQEHIAAHFNECRWACTYCAFQCNRRAAVITHVTQRHRGQPLRIIHRHPGHSKTTKDSTLEPKQSLPSRLVDDSSRRKLRGPRSHREWRHISTSAMMWQCAFCSRRSLFRGMIAVHMKVSHFEQNPDDIPVVPQQWIRPPINIDAADHDIVLKQGRLSLVRFCNFLILFAVNIFRTLLVIY